MPLKGVCDARGILTVDGQKSEVVEGGVGGTRGEGMRRSNQFDNS